MESQGEVCGSDYVVMAFVILFRDPAPFSVQAICVVARAANQAITAEAIDQQIRPRCTQQNIGARAPFQPVITAISG